MAMASPQKPDEKAKSRSLSVEDRLQPWIDQAEYIILLVVWLISWAGGWVNMIAFESFAQNFLILGRYSPQFFVLLILWTIGFFAVMWLIASLRLLASMKQMIAFVQRNPLVYLLVWGVFVVILWSMTAFGLWWQFPLVQVTFLLGMLIFTAFVLFGKPTEDAPFQAWRKVAIAAILALIAFEASLQGLAYARALPFDTMIGAYTSNGRIYQDVEGFANGRVNQLGWYYPEFRLEEGTERIALIGDSYVQAIQIPKEQHMGVELESLLNADAVDNSTEVIAYGFPALGIYNYTQGLYWTYLYRNTTPREVIVFVDPSRDFDLTVSEETIPFQLARGHGALLYAYQSPEQYAEWHDGVGHRLVNGYDPTNPLYLLYRQSLVWHFANTMLDTDMLDQPLFEATDQPFGDAAFLYDGSDEERAARIYEHAGVLLDTYFDSLAERDITVKMVILPRFPAAFYEANTSGAWEAQWGGYDLFAPDEQLIELADEIGMQVFSLGQYWQQNTDVETLQTYFFKDGTGHFTETGHDAVAAALYDCFFQNGDAPAGCIAG